VLSSQNPATTFSLLWNSRCQVVATSCTADVAKSLKWCLWSRQRCLIRKCRSDQNASDGHSWPVWTLLCCTPRGSHDHGRDSPATHYKITHGVSNVHCMPDRFHRIILSKALGLVVHVCRHRRAQETHAGHALPFRHIWVRCSKAALTIPSFIGPE
jgi:hypothetical protein